VEVAALLPLGVREAGLKLHEASAGKPEQLKVICWLNPPAGVIVIVELTELPWLTVPLPGFKAILKSGGIAVTVIGKPAEVEAASLESPTYPAIIVCEPTLRVEVEKVATPEASVPLPRETEPS
jgi:hypothetical protein